MLSLTPLRSRVWNLGKFFVLMGALGLTFLVFFGASMRVALWASEVQVPSLVGRTVNERCAPSFKKVHLEMGGKNVIMIMEDADLELAVDGCLWGGFGTSGQRCTAASRVVVHERVYQKFLDAFTSRAEALSVGALGNLNGFAVDRSRLEI